MKTTFLNKLISALAITATLLTTSCQNSAQTDTNSDQLKYEFIGGYPSESTIELTYDELDIQRVSQVYLEFLPLASMQSLFKSHEQESMMAPGDVAVFTEPGAGKVNHIGLTYNTESIYATAFVDLKADGPTVIETPPNVLGIINDGWMRYITDLGNAGPDKGQGGKYLLIPEGYTEAIPEGYLVFESSTNKNWVMVRGLQQLTGTGQDAINYYKENLKIYPLAKGLKPETRYLNYSVEAANTTHPRDESYLTLLNEVVQYEPSSAFTPYELGLLKTVGIEKGKAFNPDQRMVDIYKKGVARGDAFAKSNAYANRLEDVKVYEDRQYEYLFVGGSHEFMMGNTLNLDARSLYHYEAIVITPAMTNKMVGLGSQYLAGYRDSDGKFLMGENTYKLHLPAGIPVKDFWSVTLYHPDTRSLLQNGEEKPSINSYDKPQANDDGSIDLYFGPVAPKGKESNWVKTIPGEGWTTLIRFYGPLEPYFDQTWRPNDFEKLP